jgi:hypothetical protein
VSDFEEKEGSTDSEGQVVHHFLHLLEGAGSIYTVHNIAFLLLPFLSVSKEEVLGSISTKIQLCRDSKNCNTT